MISVIMTSYLGDYQNSRKNPGPKFVRAVNSFISQDIGAENCELIIVSDGCELTNKLYLENFGGIDNIKLIKVEKSKFAYPGENRQLGVDSAKFDYITYLDSDDMFLENRLTNCYNAISQESKYPIILDKIWNIPSIANVKGSSASLKKIGTFTHINIEFAKYESEFRAGTFQFIHRRDIKTKWRGKNSPGEDTLFSNEFLSTYKILPNSIKKMIDGYVVCHNYKLGFDV